MLVNLQQKRRRKVFERRLRPNLQRGRNYVGCFDPSHIMQEHFMTDTPPALLTYGIWEQRYMTVNADEAEEATRRRSMTVRGRYLKIRSNMISLLRMM
jgi:hypothetical protein